MRALKLIATFVVCFLTSAVLGQTVNKNAGQLTVYGGRVAFIADGGCTIQADCAWANPDVQCNTAPADARPAQCAAMLTSLTRAATRANGVSDGGAP